MCFCGDCMGRYFLYVSCEVILYYHCFSIVVPSVVSRVRDVRVSS